MADAGKPERRAAFDGWYQLYTLAGLAVYRHNERWGDGNGHSHVRASLLGASLVVPFASGQLLLGTWQQIIYIDFDIRPRRREIVAQIMGE